MNLQIWLLNPYELHFDWKGLTSRVKHLFQPVVKEKKFKSHHQFRSVTCNSTFKRPKLGRWDVAVYVVPVQNFGFVGVDFGLCSNPDFMDEHFDWCGRPKAGGLTELAKGSACSEVYVADAFVENGSQKLVIDRMDEPVWNVDRRRTTNHLANLVYHEIMHNIMVKDFHHAPKVRLGREFPPEDGVASEGDSMIIAEHIGSSKRRDQWLDGFTVVDQKAARQRAPRPQNSTAG
ncbi:MAG: hypothetical protein AAF802_05905 [Planctomycetota bacterium]